MIDEGKHIVEQIDGKKDALQDERLFTYATVLNAKCYLHNMGGFYGLTYESNHFDDEGSDAAIQRIVDILERLDSIPVKDLEEGKVAQEKLLQIQLQCAKMLNEATMLWVEELNMCKPREKNE